MGKLLRLLGDEKGAMTIYGIGLKRSATGIDDIKSQLARLQGKINSNRAASLDPFEIFPADVIRKITHMLPGKNLRDMRDIMRISRHSINFFRCINSLTLPKSLLLSKSMTVSSTKNSMKIFSSSVICKGDGFINLLKVFSKGTVVGIKVKCLQLDGYHSSPQTHEILRLASNNGAFNHLITLKLSSCNLDDLFLTLMLKKSSAFRHLVIKETNFGGSMSFLNGHNDLRTLIMENSTGPSDISFSDTMIELKNLRTLTWNKIDASVFLAEGKLSGLQHIRALGVHANMLYDIARNLSFSNSIQELYLNSDRNPGNVSYSQLQYFTSLKRLRLRGSFYKRSDEEPISLPSLEDLFLEQMNDIPAISKWHLPKLRTVAIHSCDMMSIDQLPSFNELKEFLYARDCRYLRPVCYTKLVNSYEAGNIKVLGIGDAHRLYQTDGLGKVQKICDNAPHQNFIINETTIMERIQRLWRI